MDTEERLAQLRRQRLDLRRELALLDVPVHPTDTEEIARRAQQRDRLARALNSTTGEYENLFRRRARDAEGAAGLAELAQLDERFRMMFAKRATR